MNEEPDDSLEGMELDGAFRLIKKIGAGGMGSVYEAEDLKLPRRVAVKIVPARNSDSSIQKRFDKEIRTAATIEHKNLVPTLNGGFDHGYLYLVMRLVKGSDLKQLLEDGALEADRALGFLSDIAGALECIHVAGYVHRDVKPANILIADQGQTGEYVLLADLGIARALEDPAGITKGQPPGTPLYMAPETYAKWTADAKSDQYALACVVFEMLAGRPPFDGQDVGEIRDQHLTRDAPDIAEFLPGAPDGMRSALRKALSKDPSDRFESVAEFASAVGEEVSVAEEGPSRQLTPVEVSVALFGVSPDRDERASQLAMETMLTLWANDYTAPKSGEQIVSPKRRNGALRSLALGENFLEGFKGTDQAGHRLARGEDFGGSDGLGLVQNGLQALIDERTLQGSSGATLLLPFNESLLWYDARKSGSKQPWAVRKVNMRGTGVTLGRMLLDPDSGRDELRAEAAEAVEGIREALRAPSPFSKLCDRLQSLAPDEVDKRSPEPDEMKAWEAGVAEKVKGLSERIIRHCANITQQQNVPPSAKLLQVRAILALDLAHHALSQSWETLNTPTSRRFLLLAYTEEERRTNRTRVASEDTYQVARQQIAQAMIQSLAQQAEGLASGYGSVDWDLQFEARSKLEDIAAGFDNCQDQADFLALAGKVFEESSGAGYNRPVDAFRVLLESIGLISGTGQYRYLRAEPELLATLIGAVGGMPMTANEFERRIAQEWQFVVGDAEMTGTTLVETLDGSLLARNARGFAQLLVNSGLAVALSDQTCMVGQQLRSFK